MKITICVCSSRSFIDRSEVVKLAVSAQKAGVEVRLVSDLCELCENKLEEVHALAATTIVACHPRAVKSLMAFVGEDKVNSLNLRSQSADDVLEALGLKPVDISEADAAPWKSEIEAIGILRSIKTCVPNVASVWSSVLLAYMKWLMNAFVWFVPITVRTTAQPVPVRVLPAPSSSLSMIVAPLMVEKVSRRMPSG